MVWVGESVTLPATWELAITLRVELPAAAVMVTDVAFVLCQARVTLCPEIMDVGFADRVTVGAFWPELRPQLHKPANASGIDPQKIQRTDFVLIGFNTAPKTCQTSDAELALPVGFCLSALA